MKSIICLLLILNPVVQVFAQASKTETIQPATLYKNELGLMAQTNFSTTQANLLGIQYKHWINNHFGYRIIGAFRQYEAPSNNSNSTIQNDTIYRTTRHTRVSMAFIGAGIEAQRHFFKRVFLFAAVEARGGYGSGNYYNSLSIEKTNGIFAHTANSPAISGVTMFALEVTPSIGAKLQFNRLCVGTEAAFVSCSFSHTTYPSAFTSAPWEFDMTAGNLSQRIFIHYRL